jgi:LysW-gamma-L-lysine carboxypeptidase
MDRTAACRLLESLVAIPSLSGQEEEASRWLVDRMTELGFDRSEVDPAGNAVGEIGPTDASHIDTVPGDIDVRVEGDDHEARLYGRGSVDAKGPLACFTAAVARLGSDWALEADVRVVVVGAVEEEAATSKGARHIRQRFDGVDEPVPAACVIGEPSRWDRVTLGYKGRLLIDLDARRPMTHSAGPEAGVATVGVELWNRVDAFAGRFNHSHEKAFDQLLPSLRSIRTSGDGLHERVEVGTGLRLPLGFPLDELMSDVQEWASRTVGVDAPPVRELTPGEIGGVRMIGERLEVRLDYRGYEPAWRGDSRNHLARSFLAAIRAIGDEEVRPAFVVKTGTSDMNVVGPTWQCPILAYGPGDSSLDHTPHEHLHLDELWQSILVLEQALRNLAPTLDRL